MNLLLIEFLNDDPLHQHRSDEYPFYQGSVRAAGGRSTWVAVAAGADVRPHHPYVVEPDPTRRALLVEAVRQAGPSHVVLNERIPDDDLARLRAAAPAAVFLQPPEALPIELYTACERPDYDSRRLDPERPTADHFVPIILGPRCLYRRSIRDNPFFAGLDLPEGSVDRGCSFCADNAAGRLESSARDPVEQVLVQFRRYHETVRDERRSRRFMLLAAPVLHRMGDVFAGFLTVGLPPAEVFLTCRVDALLAMERDLVDGLPRLAAAGHALHLWQVGAENFSPDENLRFNKGLTPAQLDAFVALARRLEDQWPGAFVWRRYGLTMILFTPWTTLADLRCNAEALLRYGISPFSSRLQLRIGTPIERLAQRDGLVGESAEVTPDPFSTPCITHWGEDERPWRFAHPGPARIFAVMSHLFPHHGRPAWRGDVAERVDRLRDAEHALLRHPGLALRELVQLEEDHAAESEARLLERLVERWDVTDPVGARRPVDEGAGSGGALVRLVQKLVGEGDGRRLFAGWSAAEPPKPIARGAQVRLQGPEGSVLLTVTRRRPGEPSYAATRLFAVSHPADAPPSTPRARAALQAFVDDLARVEVRLAARRPPRTS